jgi:integrase/recombinase XerD
MMHSASAAGAECIGRDGHRTKGGKSRFVPMTPRLVAAMREHFAAYRFAAYGDERTPWVFHHNRTRRHYRAGTRIGTLHVSFLGAAARAKLPPGLRQHDLRHRRVTTWLAEGKNPVLVKEAMGHADLRTTMGYTHLVKEHLRALVEPAPSPTREKVARGSG